MPRLRKAKAVYGPSDTPRYSALDITEDYTNRVLGKGNIGKVEVQCHFLHKDSQWGTLVRGDGTTVCAGIIHMKIVFMHLRDCVLDKAVVRVILDGEHAVLRSYRNVFGQDRTERKRNTVEVRDVGPRSIAGTPFGVMRKTGLVFNPTVGAEGFSASAIEAFKEKEWSQITRWVLEGDTWSTNKGGTVNTAFWTLTENLPEGQPSHSSSFRTAFVFANDGNPFFLRVEIDGSLRKTRDRAKETLKEIFSFGSKRDGTAPVTTLIRGFEKKATPLDKFAENLEADMLKRNMDIDFNRREDGQASNDKVGKHEEDTNLKPAVEPEKNIAMEAKQPTEFVIMVRQAAEFGNIRPCNGSVNGTMPTATLLPDTAKAASPPHPSTTKETEQKVHSNLFIAFCLAVLSGFQQLLLLGQGNNQP